MVYAAAGSAADLPCTLSYLPSAFGMRVVAALWSHRAGGHLQDWAISPNVSSRSFPLHLPVVEPGDAGQYRCAVSVEHRTINRDVTLAVLTGERRDWEVLHPPRGPSVQINIPACQCNGHSRPRAGNKISIQGTALHWTLLESGLFLGDLIIPLKKRKTKKII